MKQKIVGTFSLGLEYCELVLREGDGGEFYLMPEEGHVPRIKVGADYDKWTSVVATILHEAMELALARLRCRFFEQDECGMDPLGYIFFAQHKDFSDACARVADFLAAAIPPAQRAWEAWKREAKVEATKRDKKKRTRVKR